MTKAINLLILLVISFQILALKIDKSAQAYKILGTDYTYYSITDDNPLKLQLDSRGELTLYLRAFKSSKISLYLNNRHYKDISIKSKKSKKYCFEGFPNRKITTAEIFKLKIPKGKTDIKLTSSDTLFARPSFTPNLSLVTIHPKDFKSSSRLNIKGKSYTYYTANPNRSISYKLIGPLEFHLYSRIKYKTNHKPEDTSAKYRIQYGKEKSSRTHTYTYSDEALLDKQPVSKAVSEIIQIPKGEQELIITPLDTTLYFRAYIPKNNIKP